MIILGVILALIGYLFAIPYIGPIGIILIVVGVVLLVLGNTGRPVRGRKMWY